MANAETSSRSRFYITTAIAYPNGAPHIGHAYEAIATDALARFQRLDGKDVFFLTGTDEHGLKMIQTALKEGMTPHEMAANGDIYLSSYAGWYSVRDEAYYAEDETVVGEDKVRRGPQGTPVEWVKEKSYFFKLSDYQDKLLKLYESQPDFIE